VSGFDTPPMVGMPYTPPYYAKRLAETGYVKAKDLHALRVTIADIVTKHIVQLENVTARLRAEGRLGVRIGGFCRLPSAKRNSSSTSWRLFFRRKALSSRWPMVSRRR